MRSGKRCTNTAEGRGEGKYVGVSLVGALRPTQGRVSEPKSQHRSRHDRIWEFAGCEVWLLVWGHTRHTRRAANTLVLGPIPAPRSWDGFVGGRRIGRGCGLEEDDEGGPCAAAVVVTAGAVAAVTVVVVVVAAAAVLARSALSLLHLSVPVCPCMSPRPF